MAGEVFAFPIAEERIVGAFIFHTASLAKLKCGGRPSQHRSVKKVLRRPARGYVYSLSKAVHTNQNGKEKSSAPRAELQKHMGGYKREFAVLLTASVSPQSVKHQTGRFSGSASLSAYLPNQRGQWYYKRTPHHSGGTARDLHPFPYSPTTACGHLKGYSIRAKYSTAFFLCQERENVKYPSVNHKKTP